jgi:RHS repeat-associated protein
LQDSQQRTNTSFYDVLRRLTSRRFGGAGQTPLRVDVTYNVWDEIATEKRYTDLSGNTLVGLSSYAYDALHRMAYLQQQDGSSNVLANYTYTYDAASRLTVENSKNDSLHSYSYDAVNQLTAHDANSYQYDLNGNRTGGSYQTTLANEMTHDGSLWTYVYDSNGNIIKKTQGSSADTWIYGYDNLNHMISAKFAHSDGGAAVTLATYVYDVFGDRIEKDVWTSPGPTTITQFAYDGQDIWADFTPGTPPTLQTRYLHGDHVDEMFARTAANGTAAWYLTDRLGSVRDIANASGSAIDHLFYDGFGNVVTEQTPANGDRYKYTARELDAETNLQYNHARYYGATFGRWTTQDPLEFAATDRNLYRYVGDGPTDAVDPIGLLAITSKSVPWPQTGYLDGKFYFYWGVALYIDDAGLKELANANPPGGYIVSERTITSKIGDNPKEFDTAWHLNQITVRDGKLVPNNDFSKNAEGKGGARSMSDGSTALTYFSVINVPANARGIPQGYADKKGTVTVELSWKLYKCAADAATIKKFPNVGKEPKGIGWDEYVHTRWTGDDPKIKTKPLAEGKIDATITWEAPDKYSFTSSNKDITSGPNRLGRDFFFAGWEYKNGKWQPR